MTKWLKAFRIRAGFTFFQLNSQLVNVNWRVSFRCLSEHIVMIHYITQQMTVDTPHLPVVCCKFCLLVKYEAYFTR